MKSHGDTVVGVCTDVIASIDQNCATPGLWGAFGMMGAGQDTHGVVAVQHSASL